MTASEIAAAERIAPVLRAARKKQGLTQEDVARGLSITQGAVSKLERAQLVMSAPAWFEFCALTGIPVQSFESGLIEHASRANVMPDGTWSGRPLPGRYREARGSKVRLLRLYLRFLERSWGAEKRNAFLQSRKLDPDFFLDLENQLNLQFIYDLLDEVIRSGDLRPETLPLLAGPMAEAGYHGGLWKILASAMDSIEGIRLLIEHMEFYECNFRYRIEAGGKTWLHASVTPQEHVEQFRAQSDSMGDVLCGYKKEAIQQFAGLASRGLERIQVRDLACQYHGDDRCIYEVRLQ